MGLIFFLHSQQYIVLFRSINSYGLLGAIILSSYRSLFSSYGTYHRVSLSQTHEAQLLQSIQYIWVMSHTIHMQNHSISYLHLHYHFMNFTAVYTQNNILNETIVSFFSFSYLFSAFFTYSSFLHRYIIPLFYKK